ALAPGLPAAWSRVDFERRPDLLGPGPHPGEAEVAVGDARGVEALAVVGDPQPEAAPALADRERHLAGGGVLDDVVERLLADPVKHLLEVQREAVLEVARDDDRQADAALEGGGMGSQGRQQAVLLDVAR